VSTYGLKPTFVAIYTGAAGANGVLLFDLTDGIAGNMVVKKISGTAIRSNLSKLMTEQLYLVIGTAENPTGEIRGQVSLAADIQFVADLKGGEVVPPVSGSAYGLGSFVLARDRSTVQYKIICQGLTGAITGLTLHAGGSGTNGAMMLDLTNSVKGNVATGSFAPSAEFVAGLLAGQIHLNVGTAANPAAAIRSQLRRQWGFVMETFSQGTQMVPEVTTNGQSLGVYRITPTLDSLFYDIVMDNLSSRVDYMHLHVGYPNQAYSGLQIDFTNAVSGRRARGVVRGSALSASSMTRLLTSNLTLITHTARHPDGEIRGHLYRMTHEGYALQLTDQQGGSGYGSGYVTVSGQEDRAYYTWLAGNLSTAPVKAEFVLLPTGQSKMPIYDMTSTMQVSDGNVLASGAWTSQSTPAFVQGNAFQFDERRVYIDLSTVGNPNGELRGQALPGMVFFNATTAVSQVFNGREIAFDLSPNPFHTGVNVQLDGLESTAPLMVQVLDVYGKTLHTQRLGAVTGAVNTRLELPALANGVYFVVLSDGRQVLTRRMVKQD
jgi:CHRD domain/Secretion system C-terminal sorting domain